MQLYDLAAADETVRFSPNCWRTIMALAHKGQKAERLPWRFTDKEAIAASGQGKTPVLVDGETWVADSWAIAEYLDATYPEKPLFESAEAKSLAFFFKCWVEATLNGAIAKQIIVPLFAMLADKDKAYFRETREKVFGMTLEEFGADAEAALPKLRQSLHPMRMALRDRAFVSGEGPGMADYIAFGAFQWARTSAPHDLLAEDDVGLRDWRERMLDLYDGLGRTVPARAA